MGNWIDVVFFSLQGNVAVKPRKGDGLLFWSVNNENTIDPHSMHAGCPVIAGEKWTATKWIHARPFRWSAPAPPKAPPGCDNKHELCKAWANAGECKKNPGFMLGGEVAGQCVKSCCANGEDVKMPEQLTAWQLEFCASCAGSRYEREFKEMRQSGSIGRGG